MYLGNSTKALSYFGLSAFWNELYVSAAHQFSFLWQSYPMMPVERYLFQ